MEKLSDDEKLLKRWLESLLFDEDREAFAKMTKYEQRLLLLALKYPYPLKD